MPWSARSLGPDFGDYQAGYRFGQLGLELVERRGLNRFKARVYLDFGSQVNPWTRHVRRAVVLVRRAFDAAQQAGDLKYAAYSCQQPDHELSRQRRSARRGAA